MASISPYLFVIVETEEECQGRKSPTLTLTSNNKEESLAKTCMLSLTPKSAIQIIFLFNINCLEVEAVVTNE